jgi:hypothetical protein
MLAEPWHRLGGAVHRHLGAFLGADRIADGIVVPPPGTPAPFAADLAAGGLALRAAFPDLVRQVVSIERTSERGFAIRIACAGTHDGPFFGFVRPTHRRVRFEELHHVRIDGGRIVEDRLELDLRAIVRQISRDGSARGGAAPRRGSRSPSTP